MNQLAHRTFASAFVRVGPMGDVAVKIFRDRDLRGQRAPALWHLHVFLFENHRAAVVGDFGRAPFPLDLIEWRHRRIAEHARNAQSTTLFSGQPICSATGRFCSRERRQRDVIFELNHKREGKVGCEYWSILVNSPSQQPVNSGEQQVIAGTVRRTYNMQGKFDPKQA